MVGTLGVESVKVRSAKSLTLNVTASVNVLKELGRALSVTVYSTLNE